MNDKVSGLFVLETRINKSGRFWLRVKKNFFRGCVKKVNLMYIAHGMNRELFADNIRYFTHTIDYFTKLFSLRAL